MLMYRNTRGLTVQARTLREYYAMSLHESQHAPKVMRQVPFTSSHAASHMPFLPMSPAGTGDIHSQTRQTPDAIA
jgi:hypothetical protein